MYKLHIKCAWEWEQGNTQFLEVLKCIQCPIGQALQFIVVEQDAAWLDMVALRF